MSSEPGGSAAALGPRWKPVSAIDRRVLGVLVEKAKTTPDAYPLSLNGLVTGCNQKNNRDPITQYSIEDVEQSVDRLRMIGAVAAVQGSSRVSKYRHYMYEWLGVDKVELGVMAELLLRGAQTVGELRGRAARMDPIPDLAALKPVLDSLTGKGLVQSLTPEGRGQLVTHTLYLPEEMEKVRRKHAGDGSAHHAASSVAGAYERSVASPARPVAPTASAAVHAEPSDDRSLHVLQATVESLRGELAQLREDFSQLATQVERNTAGVDRIRQSLGE